MLICYFLRLGLGWLKPLEKWNVWAGTVQPPYDLVVLYMQIGNWHLIPCFTMYVTPHLTQDAQRNLSS